MMDFDLAGQLADVLPSVDQSWSFSSPPGWYLSDAEYPTFWDGANWHDPAGDLQARITELVIPHLEQIFKQGFAAGIAAVRQENAASARIV
ncbi:hypothetical protein M1247_12415 [Mycobacterium sp. 21AC1]|uniref:hypothetical protein n=1 Tax=[Mycobacterium] appelbergii TaxID=2939269 RepID=UPI0029391F5A|nr:hypothetical protein [Mycobacterium sp. 21AC1]MDV3125722.1 hypothetical protein [Mycobacterium sp. 21AC1]